MKSIKTLITDIQRRLVSGEPFDNETVNVFADNLARKLANRLSEEKGKPSLRLSNLGTPCARKLWYSIRKPELGEPLSAAARLKFLFGDILEEVVLFLARAAGHEVKDEQKEVNIDGVTGHIDGIVDGELVDVKSASTYSFNKFREHRLLTDDPFGYITQMGSYAAGLGNFGRGNFLAVDKTLGHLTLDPYETPDAEHYKKLVAERREMLGRDTPPNRGYRDEPDGASGNRKLGIACSYCQFKLTCWPGLRVFKYANKPVFLTKVERLPKVPEMKLSEVI